MHFWEGVVELGVFWDTKVFGHFVTQYCELRNDTICIGKPTIPAFRCVKNQLATRSGSLCGEKSASEVFNDFPGPEKCLKRNKTRKRTYVRTDGHTHGRTPHGRPYLRIWKNCQRRSVKFSIKCIILFKCVYNYLNACVLCVGFEYVRV